MPAAELSSPPRVGMVATVRNRRGIVASVEPFDGGDGRLYLVRLEYKDDQLPLSEELVWELEPRGQLLEPTELPQVRSGDPMPADDFDALLRATRWSAMSPYLDPDGEGPLERLPIASPFHGAVQVEDYQLVPLLKALQMPRVSLLIADDVGLGKTIEAGLILSELLLRRRIQRVLILTPASLRLQWRDEMWDKFSLHFNIVDRQETHKLRRQLGIDANPWRSFSRIIASYHYLRQDDVLEQFLAASRTPEGSPHLSWDLLILDECHNLMPAPFGDDSGLCKMLRYISPQFEHRLYLSATPHNGHTRSFTGMLELLDPVRFSQTDELKPAERARVEQVVIRRLKREINARTSPPRFCTRMPPKALILDMSPAELGLSEAFAAFRTRVRALIASGSRQRRRAGTFAVEILGKRLLSCPTAFAESWHRCKEGLAEDAAAGEADVAAAERNVREETADDRESQSRESTASAVVGSWMKTLAVDLGGEIEGIDKAISGLGLDPTTGTVVEQDPSDDARFGALCGLVDELIRDGRTWRDDERLVVFTEYKTTLDYVVRRLRQRYRDDDAILTLFGGLDDVLREQIKAEFNDPDAQVRILVATDAAAEGLNLQRTARYMLHYDCPWNPSKLEQRNGRLDRHGQARDVTIHHFVSDDDADLSFLSHVIGKVDQIREDLGSTGELFDEATHRRLIGGEDASLVQADLERQIDDAKNRAAFDADDRATLDDETTEDAARLKEFANEIDLDPWSIRQTLEAAMAIRVGRPQLECSEERRTCRIINPGLPGWADVIDETLRQKASKGVLGPVPQLAFDETPFIEQVGGRQIFNPRNDTVMMHLAHPMMQKASGSLARSRFPGPEAVSRWTVRLNGTPRDVDAIVVLAIEELAVNELRETYHHWIRTVLLPIKGDALGKPLPHKQAIALRDAQSTNDTVLINRARDLVEDVEPDLRNFIRDWSELLSNQLRRQLELDGEEAKKAEEKRYRSRQGEVSALIAENTMAKLERDISKLRHERDQGLLGFAADRLDELERSIEQKQEELERRKTHYEDVRQRLEQERDRILKNLLPRRYAMSGDAQVFPVCIEVRFPGGDA